VTSLDVIVVAGAVVVLGVLGWFFFGSRRAGIAGLHGEVQEAHVTVRGGYSPDVIRAREGVPLRLVFDRRESGNAPPGWCSRTFG
jgi:Cu+-exporting ATPase